MKLQKRKEWSAWRSSNIKRASVSIYFVQNLHKSSHILFNKIQQ